MKFRHHRKLHHRGLLLMALTGAAVLSLQGCFRGSWHDPERLEKKMTHIEEEVAEELELRADQRPAFLALTEKLKDHARKKVAAMKEGGLQVQAELEKPEPDMDSIAELAKQHVRDRASNEEFEQFIDEINAFYRSLDSTQQATVRENAARHLKWHF